MQTDPSSIQVLFAKYVKGKASAEETELLFQLIGANKHDPEILRLLDSELAETSFVAYDPAWELTLEKIKEEVLEGEEMTLAPKRNYRLWYRVSVAAAILLVIGVGLWFYSATRHLDDRRDLLNYANDIAPGKNGATITLANGKVIQLSDMKSGVVIGSADLKYDDNTLVIQSDSEGSRFLETRNDKVLEMTAKTTKGQTYEFTLPDGTKVWLNAASSIKFPSKFTGSERIVELTGEGYFEVAKDKKHKFMVRSAGQELSVLGTHFNVNAYADEGSVKTTLLEGSVRVAIDGRHSSNAPRHPEFISGSRNGKANTQTIILKPNQQSVLNNNTGIKVQQVNPEDAVAWKNGLFVFYNEDIKSVMRKVSRWYDVDVEYAQGFKSQTFVGTISRFKNISSVLEMLETTGAVHFKIEGRRVVIRN
ncbi:FecR family protein [Pedobacter frigoris]|uniref:FecR family protein n=1 Tax=Pedobacter frigoris TaxID=2571272 RepID=UPI00292F15DA|nr:FecR domain-containing protein [Pedobacter frigoris]